ncbi:unnamed protein product [Closterium sp. Naga37s-1]|nr:unnamed protein product [Closterium sp. Naga37s-1]
MRAGAGNEHLVSRLELASRLEGHHGCVNTVSFTPCGDLLLSGSDDWSIVLWDWARALQRLRWRSGHENNVFQARALPHTGNRTVVSCAADGQVRCSILKEGGSVDTKRLARHRGRAHKLAVDPTTPHCFLSCGEDGVVRHFDLRQDRPSTKLLTCQLMRSQRALGLNAIVVNPLRPHLFAVGGADEFARLYDIRRLMPVEASSLPPSDRPLDTFAPDHLIHNTRDYISPTVHITCVAFSTSDELLASYNDELIYLFLPLHGLGSDPLSAPAAARRRNRVVNCLEPHPSLCVLATSGIESNVKIWTPTAARPKPLPPNAAQIMAGNSRRREQPGGSRGGHTCAVLSRAHAHALITNSFLPTCSPIHPSPSLNLVSADLDYS